MCTYQVGMHNRREDMLRIVLTYNEGKMYLEATAPNFTSSFEINQEVDDVEWLIGNRVLAVVEHYLLSGNRDEHV